MLCGSQMEREFGGKWIHVYVCLSPFAVHLKLSQHLLISYTVIENKTQNSKSTIKKNLIPYMKITYTFKNTSPT